MPKHVGPADSTPTGQGPPAYSRGTYLVGSTVPRWFRGALVLLAATTVVVLGVVVVAAPTRVWAAISRVAGAGCAGEPVEIIVAPELREVITDVLAPLEGTELGAGRCLHPVLRAQEPDETVASSALLPLDRAPQLWIPDATVWGEKVSTWPLVQAGALASSPLVVMTSIAAVDHFGWNQRTPTWAEALNGDREVVLPGIGGRAPNLPGVGARSQDLRALIALRQTLAASAWVDAQVSDAVLVATVLSARRSDRPDLARAIARAQSGVVDAPLIPVTEQTVAALNASAITPRLTAVYPKEGSPMLDYPIYRTAVDDRRGVHAAATDLVVERLRSEDTREILRQKGFRRPVKGSDASAGEVRSGQPVGTGILPTTRLTVLENPAPADLDAVVERVEALTRPSRLLTVIDVSAPMRGKVTSGRRAITVAASTVGQSLDLLPDTASVGIWASAAKITGGYRALAPVLAMGSGDLMGGTQRQDLAAAIDALPEDLTDGGSSLYASTLAAVRQMHRDFDPTAQNAVVVLSAGADSDPDGPTLAHLLAQIRDLDSGSEKVPVYTVGVGAGADYRALAAIAEASGGHTYRVDTPAAGRQAFIDGLRRNRHLTPGT